MGGDPDRGHHPFSGEQIGTLLPFKSASRINDAVALLEDEGYVETLKTFGTAPYAFNTVKLTPKGRLLYQRLKAADEREREQAADAPTHSGDDDDLTDAQRHQILEGIQSTKALVESLVESGELSSEQARRTAEALDRIVEISTRVGRKDIRMLVIGAFSTLILDHVLSPGLAHTVLEFLQAQLGPLLGGGPLQLPS